MSNCDKFNFTESNGCTELNVGFDFDFGLTYKINDVAEDITSYTFTGTIEDDEGNVLFNLSEVVDDTSTGLFKDDPVNGHLRFIIIESDTNTFTNGSYKYILRNVFNGKSDLFMTGYINAVEA